MDVHDATAQHQQAIAAQKRTLQRAQLRRGQTPSDLKLPSEVHTQFMMLLMSRRLEPEKKLIYSTFVPPAYLPCITPIADLRPITIRDLQLEIHHRGRCIFVRSITPPCRMTAIMAVVEDELGDVLKIQLYQQVDEDERSATDIIDVGTILLLKEPFFKVMGDGEYGLRVDHLSDVVAIDNTDDRVPKAGRHKVIEMQDSTELKASGNSAMGEKRYWAAIRE